MTRRQRRPLLSDDVVGRGTFKVEVERRTCGWMTSNEDWGDWEEGWGGHRKPTSFMTDTHRESRSQINVFLQQALT